MPMNLKDEIVAGESYSLEFKRVPNEEREKYLKTVKESSAVIAMNCRRTACENLSSTPSRIAIISTMMRRYSLPPIPLRTIVRAMRQSLMGRSLSVVVCGLV